MACDFELNFVISQKQGNTVILVWSLGNWLPPARELGVGGREAILLRRVSTQSIHTSILNDDVLFTPSGAKWRRPGKAMANHPIMPMYEKWVLYHLVT